MREREEFAMWTCVNFKRALTVWKAKASCFQNEIGISGICMIHDLYWGGTGWNRNTKYSELDKSQFLFHRAIMLFYYAPWYAKQFSANVLCDIIVYQTKFYHKNDC